MTFGERIVFYRSKKNINQKQLAQILGITPTRLNYWEKDKRQPDVEMIKAISEALDVSPDILIGNATSKSEQNKKSPAPEGAEDDRISVDEMKKLLRGLGYLSDGRDLTDKDVQFIGGIFDLLDAWFG